MLASSVNQAALVTGLAIGYAKNTKLIINSAISLKFNFDGYDIGMAILDAGLVMYTQNMLIKYGILPAIIVTEDMATIAMTVGGGIPNAVVFTGSNALFNLGSDDESK